MNQRQLYSDIILFKGGQKAVDVYKALHHTADYCVRITGKPGTGGGVGNYPPAWDSHNLRMSLVGTRETRDGLVRGPTPGRPRAGWRPTPCEFAPGASTPG